jgi:PAS domain S-box-containing protein
VRVKQAIAAQERLTKAPADARGAVFEASANPMLVVDDDRVYVDANPAAARLLRMAREALIGQRIDDLTPADRLAELPELWESFMKSGTMAGSYDLVTPDGTRVRVDYNATAHILPGRHLGIIVGPESTSRSTTNTAEPIGAPLSPREREVLRLVAQGATGDEVARQLQLSPETVRRHVRRARDKLGAANRSHAIALALQRGEIEL